MNANMKLDNLPRRVWINQPSTLQPDHALDGMNVLAIRDTDTMARIYFLSGPIESQQISYLALSEGWLTYDEHDRICQDMRY